jgi:hypothetical protein
LQKVPKALEKSLGLEGDGARSTEQYDKWITSKQGSDAVIMHKSDDELMPFTKRDEQLLDSSEQLMCHAGGDHYNQVLLESSTSHLKKARPKSCVLSSGMFATIKPVT